MARRTELTAKLAGELPSARSYACDVTEAASVEAAFAATRSDLGDVDALIYNAGSGVWGHVEEVEAEDLERSWRVNTLGLFLSGQQVIAAMRKLLVLCFGVLKTSKEFDPAMAVCRATAWRRLHGEPKLERETVVKPRSPSGARFSARA